MKAVLHDWASAVFRSIRPGGCSDSRCSSRTSCRRRSSCVGQVTGEPGSSPARSRASELITLNVEPGAARPTVASDWPLVPALLAATSTAPVEGRMTTMEAAGLVFASIFSASRCRVGCSVVSRAWPATGLASKTVTGSTGSARTPRGSGDGLGSFGSAGLGGDQPDLGARACRAAARRSALQSASDRPGRRRRSPRRTCRRSPWWRRRPRRSPAGRSRGTARASARPGSRCPRGSRGCRTPSGRSSASARSTIASTKACGPGGGHPLRVRGGVDVDQPGQPAGRRALLLVRLDGGLVDADPVDRPARSRWRGRPRRAACRGRGAAGAGSAGCCRRAAVARCWAARPTFQRTGSDGQGGLGLVRPVLRHAREGPGQVRAGGRGPPVTGSPQPRSTSASAAPSRRPAA